VTVGEFTVDLGSEVILGGHLLAGEAEYSYVSASQNISVRQRIKSVEEARYGGIHLHRPGREHACACCHGRHGIDVGHAQGLAEALVVGEEESAALLYRRSHRSTELIPLEGRDLSIEEVSGVQRAVAQEFICISVKGI